MLKCDIKKTLAMSLLGTCIIFTLVGCSRNNGVKYYYDSEEFNTETNSPLYIPDGAEDLRMAVKDSVLSKTYLCSYVLDDNELSAFIEKTIDEKYTKSNDDGSENVVFDDYYSIIVADIDNVDSTYELDDFPFYLAFDAVIDDPIEDYLVIYYYPADSGTHSEAILYNVNTNRVVEYYYATIR